MEVIGAGKAIAWDSEGEQPDGAICLWGGWGGGLAYGVTAARGPFQPKSKTGKNDGFVKEAYDEYLYVIHF